jgi:hypothetical protein
MRTARRGATIPLVHEAPETVELTVTLAHGSEPVRGGARLPDGQRREFWGWLELAEIVQDVVADDLGLAGTTREPRTSVGAQSRW